MQPQSSPTANQRPDRPSRNSDDGETVVVDGQRGSYRWFWLLRTKGVPIALTAAIVFPYLYG